MSIRTSRAKGTSEKIEVDSLGGQPDHKKNKSTPKPANAEASERMPFCGECGHKHASAELNFCCKCGKQREPIAATDAASTDVTVTATTLSELPGPATPDLADIVPATQDLATNDSATTTKSGRPSTRCRLRCGWSIIEGEYVAPDGKKFSCRKAAAKYFNVKVPKLEPERQDGWQVFANETMTHFTWIAPDGQKLGSFVSAKAYSRSSNFPIFGKDGVTTSIASFFGKKTKQNKPTGTTDELIDLTCTTNNNPPTRQQKKVSTDQVSQSRKQQQVGTKSNPPTCQQKKVPTDQVSQTHKQQQAAKKQKPEAGGKKKQKRRTFTIPNQTIDGQKLQQLLHEAAIMRNQKKHRKLAVVKKNYEAKYTKKRLISDGMAAKVSVIYILI